MVRQYVSFQSTQRRFERRHIRIVAQLDHRHRFSGCPVVCIPAYQASLGRAGMHRAVFRSPGSEVCHEQSAGSGLFAAL